MIMTSFKSVYQFYHSFWLPAFPLMWSNYTFAWDVVSPYLLNTFWYSGVAVIAIVFFASLAAFAFARYRFPGDDFFFYATISLLMIPSVFQLVPLFMQVKQLNLINTPWAVILVWMARGQPFDILVFRTFFANLPQEVFDAAQVDGANQFQTYWLLALPMAKPVIVIILIVELLSTWNDFIWPLIAIADDALRPISVGLRYFQGAYSTQYGAMMAGYVIATAPLLIFFLLGMRQFVQGLATGAVKG
jgi:multiple sugar transport system permease protein/raffinose/stachyose/melibiose transport system permease protein